MFSSSSRRQQPSNSFSARYGTTKSTKPKSSFREESLTRGLQRHDSVKSHRREASTQANAPVGRYVQQRDPFPRTVLIPFPCTAPSLLPSSQSVSAPSGGSLLVMKKSSLALPTSKPPVAANSSSLTPEESTFQTSNPRSCPLFSNTSTRVTTIPSCFKTRKRTPGNLKTRETAQTLPYITMPRNRR
jgi:hypothetical protein